MKESHRDETAFSLHYRLYRFIRMPFLLAFLSFFVFLPYRTIIILSCCVVIYSSYWCAFDSRWWNFVEYVVQALPYRPLVRDYTIVYYNGVFLLCAYACISARRLIWIFPYGCSKPWWVCCPWLCQVPAVPFLSHVVFGRLLMVRGSSYQCILCSVYRLRQWWRCSSERLQCRMVLSS